MSRKGEIARLRAKLKKIKELTLVSDDEGDRWGLEIAIRHLVIGEIVQRYTFIDELLTTTICRYYFKLRAGRVFFAPHWRTNKFKIFVHHMMESTYLLKKLDIVGEIGPIPKEIRSLVCEINDLRNDVAHGYYPEERKRNAKKRKVTFRKKDVFSARGLAFFQDKMGEVEGYLYPRAMGRRISKQKK